MKAVLSAAFQPASRRPISPPSWLSSTSRETWHERDHRPVPGFLPQSLLGSHATKHHRRAVLWHQRPCCPIAVKRCVVVPDTSAVNHKNITFCTRTHRRLGNDVSISPLRAAHHVRDIIRALRKGLRAEGTKHRSGMSAYYPAGAKML